MSSFPHLLFIHGAHSDARIWQAGFQQSFEQRGWPCHALDLPAHGQQRDGSDIERFGLADYVAAIAAAASACPQPPVLVGHSMGGYLAQRYLLEGGQAAALVLLASAPPQGMARDLLGFALRHPLLALRFEWSGQETAEARRARVREMLMTEATPEETVAWVDRQLQRESARALRELALQTLPARPLAVPVFAAAGAHDKLISLASQRALASAYGVPLEVQTEMGHMLSVEPGWPLLADRVADFLVQGLPRNR